LRRSGATLALPRVIIVVTPARTAVVRPWFAVRDETVIAVNGTHWPAKDVGVAAGVALAVPRASAHTVTAATAVAMILRFTTSASLRSIPDVEITIASG
jgi:hypothetical protein